MMRFAIPLAAAAALTLAACRSTNTRDLARNDQLYQPTRYQAQHPQRRSVWIEPLQDRRGKLASHAGGVRPLTYTEDSFWARPIVPMLEDILRREIADSGIFTGIADSRDNADWVIETAVIEFHGVIEERLVGRSVHGRATLHVRTWGQRGTDGKRPLLRENRYIGPAIATGMLMLPDPHALAGAALRKSIVQMLGDLDHGGQLKDGRASEAVFEDGRKTDWR